MDVLSHALLGFILGQALRLDSGLQLVLIVSSVSLDIDALSLRNREAAVRTHRGPLHSIPAAVVAATATATGYVFFLSLPATALLSVVPVCLVGLLSHLVLDVSTIGGVRALWPISNKNFALNLAHFIDPIFLGTLLLAALFTLYFQGDVAAVQIVTAMAAAFLIVISAVRFFEKNAATKILNKDRIESPHAA